MKIAERLSREATEREFWLAIHARRAAWAISWLQQGYPGLARIWAKEAREALQIYHQAKQEKRAA